MFTWVCLDAADKLWMVAYVASIGDTGALPLAASLKENKTLTRLNLFGMLDECLYCDGRYFGQVSRCASRGDQFSPASLFCPYLVGIPSLAEIPLIYAQLINCESMHSRE